MVLVIIYNSATSLIMILFLSGILIPSNKNPAFDYYLLCLFFLNFWWFKGKLIFGIINILGEKTKLYRLNSHLEKERSRTAGWQFEVTMLEWRKWTEKTVSFELKNNKLISLKKRRVVVKDLSGQFTSL
jgi:hypothetical protein